ncbi:TUP1-like enhancer of split domain-containing protein [Ditylenchus destructor]|uniref:Protein HIRA n=1 Tax=Ditylenchus destructor TaxID=166010 RepID=A0AAD4QVG3_9BILA|nr:TUP1-like enhancer of split domain-containing protein [Ditylenchus destructor]
MSSNIAPGKVMKRKVQPIFLGELGQQQQTEQQASTSLSQSIPRLSDVDISRTASSKRQYVIGGSDQTTDSDKPKHAELTSKETDLDEVMEECDKSTTATANGFRVAVAKTIPLPQFGSSRTALRPIPESLNIVRSDDHGRIRLDVPVASKEIISTFEQSDGCPVNTVTVQNDIVENRMEERHAKITARFVDNVQPGTSSEKRTLKNLGGTIIWERLTNNSINSIKANSLWIAAASEDGSLHIFFTKTGKCHTIMHLDKTITHQFLSHNGIPLIMFKPDIALVFSRSLDSWLTVNAGSEGMLSRLVRSLKLIATAVPNGLISNLSVHLPAAKEHLITNPTIAAAYEEAQLELLMEATKQMDSNEEFRLLLNIYGQKLANKGKWEKLIEVVEDFRKTSQKDQQSSIPFDKVVEDIGHILKRHGIDGYNKLLKESYSVDLEFSMLGRNRISFRRISNHKGISDESERNWYWWKLGPEARKSWHTLGRDRERRLDELKNIFDQMSPEEKQQQLEKANGKWERYQKEQRKYNQRKKHYERINVGDYSALESGIDLSQSDIDLTAQEQLNADESDDDEIQVIQAVTQVKTGTADPYDSYHESDEYHELVSDEEHGGFYDLDELGEERNSVDVKPITNEEKQPNLGNQVDIGPTVHHATILQTTPKHRPQTSKMNNEMPQSSHEEQKMIDQKSVNTPKRNLKTTEVNQNRKPVKRKSTPATDTRFGELKGQTKLEEFFSP